MVSRGDLRLFLFFPLIVVSFDVPQDLLDVELDVGERADHVPNLVAVDAFFLVHGSRVPTYAQVAGVAAAQSPLVNALCRFVELTEA